MGSNGGPNGPNGPKASGQVPMGIPSSGYQYINKQVNNVKLVNNNNLTLNVRNFNNRISSINISNIQEEAGSKVKTGKAQGPGQMMKTQRYS